MKRIIIVLFLFCGSVFPCWSEVEELVPFGDMESWVVRYIKESALLGGQTKILYAIGKKDTIRKNGPYKFGKDGSVWGTSNAYANVIVIEKAACSMIPEYRDKEHGYCCRLDAKLLGVKVLGMINIKVLVSGTLYTGRVIEPVTTAKDPYQNVDFGVPFTKKPKALMFDYKCLVSPEQWVWYAKGFGAPKKQDGHDEAEVYLFLQKRWEDQEGNIYASRVGMAYERYFKDQKEWVNRHVLPIFYGDPTHESWYKEYMGLGQQMRATNSKGKIVPIQEKEWGNPNDTPTHMILMMSCGRYEAFVGHEGNALWVDNVKLIYD